MKSDHSTRLIQVLAALDAEELLRVLDRERRGKRNDYPNRVMWYSLMAGLIYGRATITSLIEELHINPGLRYLCGIERECGVPTASAFSRFLKRLIKHQDLLEAVFHQTVDSLGERVPGLGKNIAIDSTDVHAYANEHGKASSDPDARWGVKGRERNYAWLGYKLHLLVCGDYELPLAFKVTPANKPD
ncbi:MAG: transposase, partial [Methanocella sp.]